MRLHVFQRAFQVQVFARLKALRGGDVGLLQVSRDLYSLGDGFGTQRVREKKNLYREPEDRVDDRREEQGAVCLR